MTAVDKLVDQLVPDVTMAARANRRVRFVPFLPILLSWLVPLLVRFVVEFLLSRYGNMVGKMLDRLLPAIEPMAKPEVLKGLRFCQELCHTPPTSFTPEVRATRVAYVGEPWQRAA
jgi:hypothetical protein